MSKEKHVSFLNQILYCNIKERIWKPVVATLYGNDTIELKFDCYYICQEKRILKPINLEFGVKTLYKIKEGTPKGRISLNFTTMTYKNQEGQSVFRIQKNNKILDIVTQNSEQLKKIFTKKCILTTFHEDYHIEKFIQNGNKNKNYFVAIQKATKERFSVKAYSKEMLQLNKSKRENLKNEIKALRMLNQEGIIKLHEVHETQNSIYLIMDLVLGGQLSSNVINSDKDIKQLIYNLLKTLHYLSLKRCWLRNLSPENILLKNKETKVDIVLYNFAEVQFDWKKPQQNKLEVNNQLAPELQDTINQSLQGKCDVYSAGVIFYKLVTGDNELKDFQQFDERETINHDFFYNLKANQQTKKAQQSLMKKMLRVNQKLRYSAEKCLSHRYFKQIFQPADLLPELKQTIIMSEKYKNQEKESPRSILSNSSGSANDSQKEERKKYSKFNQQGNEIDNSLKVNSNQKRSEVSLLKLAVQNSFLQNQVSKDDNFITMNPGKADINRKRNSLNV